MAHTPEQPSPGLALPSSHSSLLPTTPSPHTSAGSPGSPPSPQSGSPQPPTPVEVPPVSSENEPPLAVRPPLPEEAAGVSEPGTCGWPPQRTRASTDSTQSDPKKPRGRIRDI